MLQNSDTNQSWQSKVGFQMKDFLHLSEILTDDVEINEDILAYIDAFIYNPKSAQEFEYNETLIDALNKELIIYLIVPGEEALELDQFGITKLPESLIEDRSYADFFANLRVLSCADNRLRSLPENIGKLKSLEVLNIENNQIDKLPESIKDLTYLKVLKTSGNAIKDVPDHLTSKMGYSKKQPGIKASKQPMNQTPSSDFLPALMAPLNHDLNDGAALLLSKKSDLHEPFSELTPDLLSDDEFFSREDQDSIRQLLDSMTADMAADMAAESAQATRQQNTRRNEAPSILPNYNYHRSSAALNSVYEQRTYSSAGHRVRYYEGKIGQIILPHTDPSSSAPGPLAAIDVAVLRGYPTAIPRELVTWMQQQGNTPWNYPGNWSYFVRAHYALILEEQEEDRRQESHLRF